MLPRLRVGVSLAAIEQCRPVTGKAVVVDEAAQQVGLEGREQPPFLRRVEQGEGPLRLPERDFLDISGGVHAVAPVRVRAGTPRVAGREQEDRRAQDDMMDADA